MLLHTSSIEAAYLDGVYMILILKSMTSNERKGVSIFEWRWDNFDLVDGDNIYDLTTTI
jgi:hypothetical protein